MAEMTAAQVKSKRMVYLALSVVSLLFLGLIYAFSMFAAPMCQVFGYEKAAVGLTFNIMMITFCVGAVLGSQIEKKLGVKGTLIVGAAMYAIGFIGNGAMGGNDVMFVYLFYGVIAGLGVGVGYNTVLATTNVWFPDKVGFSSGVLMMGFGLGSLIFGTLATNLYKGGMDLHVIFMAIGVIGGIVIAISGLILQRPPANIVALMCPEKAAASGNTGYDPADDDAALKTPMFYVYWVWAIIVIAVGLATIGNCASDAQAVGWDEGFATLLVGLVSVCNGLARVVIGMIFDKTNVKVTMLIDGLVSVVATVCIIGGFMLGQPVLYVVGAFCCGFCYGGVPVVASAFSRSRFGAKNYPLNLSLANFAIVFASLLNLLIQNVTAGAPRYVVFGVLFVLTIIAVLDVIPFSKMFDKGVAELEERRKAHAAKAA
ncbi:MAG: MFS transporter [Coriobacteriia bacterium]|nr:MFS transporter [Coriobacteriia bacterium]